MGQNYSHNIFMTSWLKYAFARVYSLRLHIYGWRFVWLFSVTSRCTELCSINLLLQQYLYNETEKLYSATVKILKASVDGSRCASQIPRWDGSKAKNGIPDDLETVYRLNEARKIWVSLQDFVEWLLQIQCQSLWPATKKAHLLRQSLYRKQSD